MRNKLLSFFRKPENFFEMLLHEMHQYIGAYLQPEDILNLMLVNKKLYNVYLDQYFLRSEQAFLYSIRCYNEEAALLDAKKKIIDRQVIQRNQCRFQSFEETVNNGLKVLPNDSGDSSIYNDCFKLANNISNCSKNPDLYYEATKAHSRLFPIIAFLLFGLLSIYSLVRVFDNKKGVASKIMFAAFVIIAYNFMLKSLINIFFADKIEVSMNEPIQILLWHHNIQLKKIAETFPNLQNASSIKNLVAKLIEIYEKQPSFPKNLSLHLESQKLLKDIKKLKTNKKIVFNYSDNQQLTLFGKRCDQFEAECKSSHSKHSFEF